MSDTPSTEPSQFEIELDEGPRYPRPDIFPLDLICDENGFIKPEPRKLESRGISSHPELWSKATLHKSAIVAKLKLLERSDLWGPLQECHTVETCRVCTDCRRVTIFFNRCERHYCPECAPRLARERRESVEWWAQRIHEPKHVVVTTRNSNALTREHVRWFKQCFGKLRRRKFARNWKGGFYRLEVTNEGKGWHLHMHALIDAGWIDARKLSGEWADIVGQEVAIVKVKDVHSRDYLAEVTKYTVKGSQLAGWQPAEIVEFLDAFTSVKTFGVFGSLYGKRTEWREWLDSIQGEGPVCECGCSTFRILSAAEKAWEDLESEARSGHGPGRPPPDPQVCLPLGPTEGRPAEHWKFE